MAHFPRKRFGQHFLQDPHIIQRIVAAIAPQPEQHFIEIGPGKGALTLALLQSHCRLDVIELDRDLVESLQQRTKTFKQFNIHQADALTFDFQSLKTDQPLRIVGNLPYNISTPLLFHLLDYASHVEEMIFMLQKEVVDRMIATPATSDYGRLSVMLQYHCQAYHLFNVDPSAFIPPPTVNSSLVQLIPYQTPPVQVTEFKHFSQIVAGAFCHRRKTLRNTLKNLLDVADIEAAGLNPQARAETLTLTEFAQLANVFTARQ